MYTTPLAEIHFRVVTLQQRYIKTSSQRNRFHSVPWLKRISIKQTVILRNQAIATGTCDPHIQLGIGIRYI